MSKSDKSPNIISQDIPIAYPSQEAETKFAIRKADIIRWKRQLSNVKPEDKLLRIAYSVCFGIAGAAGLSLLSTCIIPEKPPWLVPAYAFCFLAALLVAVVFLWHDRKDTKSGTGDIKLILTDIEEIEASFEQEGQTAVSDSEQQAFFEATLKDLDELSQKD